MRDERRWEGKQRWKRGEGGDSSLKNSTMAQAAFPEALNHLPLELSLAHNTCAEHCSFCLGSNSLNGCRFLPKLSRPPNQSSLTLAPFHITNEPGQTQKLFALLSRWKILGLLIVRVKSVLFKTLSFPSPPFSWAPAMWHWPCFSHGPGHRVILFYLLS